MFTRFARKDRCGFDLISDGNRETVRFICNRVPERLKAKSGELREAKGKGTRSNEIV
jgi:hypothetical protein